MRRIDGRKANELRKVNFDLNYVKYPEGSVLITMGDTKVLCNATVEPGVPAWIKEQGSSRGWITAEYSMLPRATHSRSKRESGFTSARSQEIRRLIGRALRAAVDLRKLGPNTITLDCDVLQADGGTRTAAITGGYVALAMALSRMEAQGKIPAHTLQTEVAAVSAGIVDGRELLDLCYEEDVNAQADANFVLDAHGKLIEVQATAENGSFSPKALTRLLELAQQGTRVLIKAQRQALSGPLAARARASR